MNYLSRDKTIIELAVDKSVLHLGCIGFADLDKLSRINLLPKTLHFKLYQVASKLIGLDYSKDVINEVSNVEGFNNVYYANAEHLDEIELSESFDFIVVGDLIEHLSNPGKMLEGLKLFCNPKTQIIITTPNSFGIASFFRFIVNKFKEGEEHVMTFNSYNISNLLKRHGFTVLKIDTCYQEHSKKIKLFKILKFILSTFPKLGGTLFVVVVLKKDNSN